jgi:nickel-dependent lactate racemase
MEDSRERCRLLETALDRPICSVKLEELARGKKNIVIISSDHTRPVSSKIISPAVHLSTSRAGPDV